MVFVTNYNPIKQALFAKKKVKKNKKAVHLPFARPLSDTSAQCSSAFWPANYR